MTDTDRLTLAAGIFCLVTALLGIAQPDWVWPQIRKLDTQGAHPEGWHTAITTAYFAIALLLFVLGMP